MFSRRQILIVFIVLLFLSVAVFVYFFVFKKPAGKALPGQAELEKMEKLLQELTAPASAEAPEISKEVIQSLTAPPESVETPDDILKQLTAPTK